MKSSKKKGRGRSRRARATPAPNQWDYTRVGDRYLYCRSCAMVSAFRQTGRRTWKCLRCLWTEERT